MPSLRVASDKGAGGKEKRKEKSHIKLCLLSDQSERLQIDQSPVAKSILAFALSKKHKIHR